MDNNVVLTPSALWKDFSIDMNFNTTVVSEKVVDGVVVQGVYFNGFKADDGVVRIWAVIAFQKGKSNLPAVLLCGDFCAEINEAQLIEVAKEGYCCMSFDYTGQYENKYRCTLYPKSISTANYLKSGRNLKYVDSSVFETCYYRWTMVAKYACAYFSTRDEVNSEKIGIIGLRNGGYLAWQLASFNVFAKCACSIFEGGWQSYKENYKHATTSENDKLSAERERWYAGVPSQVYAQHVKIPFLYLGATNDELGEFERVCDTISRLPKEKSYWSFSPKLSNMIDAKSLNTLKMFLAAHLKDGEQINAQQPSLAFFDEDGELCARLIVGQSDKIKDVNIYYSVDEAVPMRRDWLKIVDMKSDEFGFYGLIDMFDSAGLVYAFADVEYENGLFLTTSLICIRPSQGNFEKKDYIPSKMVYNSMEKRNCFTVIDLNEQKFANKLNVYNDDVVIKKGSFDINGVTAKKHNLCTYRLASKPYMPSENSILKFDINSKESGIIQVVAIVEYKREHEKRYTFSTELKGGDIWQKIEIPMTSFKTGEDGIQLKKWSSIDVLAFSCDNEFLVTNMLWL